MSGPTTPPLDAASPVPPSGRRRGAWQGTPGRPRRPPARPGRVSGSWPAKRSGPTPAPAAGPPRSAASRTGWKADPDDQDEVLEAQRRRAPAGWLRRPAAGCGGRQDRQRQRAWRGSGPVMTPSRRPDRAAPAGGAPGRAWPPPPPDRHGPSRRGGASRGSPGGAARRPSSIAGARPGRPGPGPPGPPRAAPRRRSRPATAVTPAAGRTPPGPPTPGGGRAPGWGG